MGSKGYVQDYDAMEKAMRLYGHATGFSREEMIRLLHQLNARFDSHEKGEVIFRQGERAHTFALVLTGNLQMLFHGVDGKPFMLQVMHPGEFAGVSLFAWDNPVYPCDVVAYPECLVAVFDLNAALALRKSSVVLPFFQTLEKQLVRSLVVSHRHAIILSQRSLATRFLSCLAMRSDAKESREVVPAGSMDDLASYLGCDRAALSRTISRLCRQGKIARHGRGHFELLSPVRSVTAVL